MEMLKLPRQIISITMGLGRFVTGHGKFDIFKLLPRIIARFLMHSGPRCMVQTEARGRGQIRWFDNTESYTRSLAIRSMGQTGEATLSTIERAMDIVDTVAELNGARVSEIADQLDIPPSTAHGHLKTLHQRSYLIKEGDEYHLGLQFLNRGGQARRRKETYRLAEEKVNSLAEETGERVQFIVEEQGRGYYIHTATGEKAVRADARIGKRTYLHDSSAGKAILAHLPEDRVCEIIERWGLPSFTKHTITEKEQLLQELEEVRDQGYAFNQQETHQGLHAVGAAVKPHQGQVLGAFSISAPSNRMKGERMEEQIPDLLQGVTNELELRLSYK